MYFKYSSTILLRSMFCRPMTILECFVTSTWVHMIGPECKSTTSLGTPFTYLTLFLVLKLFWWRKQYVDCNSGPDCNSDPSSLSTYTLTRIKFFKDQLLLADMVNEKNPKVNFLCKKFFVVSYEFSILRFSI